MTRIIFEREENGQRTRLVGKDAGDPELFVDGIWGLTVTKAGICKMNLFTIAADEDGVERREVATRLVMPLDTFFATRDFLVNHCNRLIAEGIVAQHIRDSGSSDDTDSEQGV